MFLVNEVYTRSNTSVQFPALIDLGLSGTQYAAARDASPALVQVSTSTSSTGLTREVTTIWTSKADHLAFVTVNADLVAQVKAAKAAYNVANGISYSRSAYEDKTVTLTAPQIRSAINAAQSAVAALTQAIPVPTGPAPVA